MTTKAEAANRQNQIISVLKAAGNAGMAAQDVAKAIEMEDKPTRDYLTRMQRLGVIARRGEYTTARWYVPANGYAQFVPELPRAFFFPHLYPELCN